MKHTCETLVDENGVEILVSYSWAQSPATIGTGDREYEPSEITYTELDSIEVVIKGTGINILPFMTERQKEFILSQLNYE